VNTKNLRIGNWFIDQLNLYQSANSDYSSIKKNFIIRESEYNSIINSLMDKKKDDPLQHELIIGRRGSGKSTLLKRIEIEVVENPKLNKKYLPINLAEEQAGIYRLFDLWEQVLHEMIDQLDLDLVLQEFSTFDSNDDYTHYLYQQIHQLCKKHKKRIVLLLDNFDRIVENFTDDGNLLRETLINYSDIEIVAGSTRMDEHFWKYNMPFYEFFRRHRLEALSKEEMFKLLNHWSDSLEIPELKDYVKNNPGKIENIRILTDGLPRTLQFFIQMVLQNADANSYDYLKKIMDNVSPLYQERLNSLPAQLRKTVLEIAFIWEACTTKQLVEKVKMESKLISANLKTLVEKGIVDKIETNKKNHLYRISERFFNMWLIITQGNPSQKRKAKWLSIFLENWYDANDLKKLTQKHIQNLKEGKLSWEKALITSKGLSQTKHITTSERDEIIEYTQKLKGINDKDCLIELPRKYSDIYDELTLLKNKSEFLKGIEIANSIENEEDGLKFFFLGYFNRKLNKFKEAEKYYLLAIEKGNTKAMNDLANLYQDQGKFPKAEKHYLLAIAKGSDYAKYNLALLYQNQGKYKEAEKNYLSVIEKGIDFAINNLTILYFKQNIHKEKGLELISKLKESDDQIHLQNIILIEIWNGIFNDVENRIINLITKTEGNELDWFLKQLLIHQQKNLVLQLFKSEEFGAMLQEKYSLLYYVTLLLNEHQYENLLLKIPPELKSTIDEVIANIEEKERFYGYK
jgi:TPR repeat protein